MLRVRDKSRVSSGTFQSDESYKGKPFPPNVGTRSVTSPDRMEDTLTPNFRKRSSMGEIIISPMTRLVGTRTMVNGTSAISTNTNSWRTTGVGIHLNLPVVTGWEVNTDAAVSAEVNRLVSLAITEAYAKVGSPDVALLTELAELKETLGFLMSPVKGLVSLTRKLRNWMVFTRKLEERHAARLAKWASLTPVQRSKRKAPGELVLPAISFGKFKASDVSSAWLAYRYAIMPLIYTFQDVEALLKKRAAAAPTRATARAKVGSTLPISGEVYGVGRGYDTINWRESIDISGFANITVRAGVLYVPDFSLSAQLGLQWNRVPSALYEAIPLSFVADWAYNGSEVYDALTAEFRAQKILGAWTSVSIDFDAAWYHKMVKTSGQGSCGGHGTFLTYTGQWKMRRQASLTDVQMQLRLDMNSKRVADGLALIHTMLATAIKRK